MPPASCTVCGSRLPKKSRFCPECGARVGASTDETAVQEIPEQETGPVPIDVMTAEPRFFGVTPPAAVLALWSVAGLATGLKTWLTGTSAVAGIGEHHYQYGVQKMAKKNV